MKNSRKFSISLEIGMCFSSAALFAFCSTSLAIVTVNLALELEGFIRANTYLDVFNTFHHLHVKSHKGLYDPCLELFLGNLATEKSSSKSLSTASKCIFLKHSPIVGNCIV